MLATISGIATGGAAQSFPPLVWDALADRLLHTALIRHPSGDFPAQLRAALVGAPVETQMRWLELLKARLVRRSPAGSCASCSSADAFALALGLSSSQVCAVCTANLQTPPDLLTSAVLGVSQAAQLKGVPTGSNCAGALSSAFRGLCEVSNRAYVLDRFAVSDAVRADNKNVGSSGLERFVRLADSSGVSEVELYVSAGMKIGGEVVTPSGVIQLVGGLLSAKTQSVAVIVNVLPFGPAKRLIHDRWLGFSWGGQGMVTWSLGKGLGQFDGGNTRQHHSLARQADGTIMTLKGQLDPEVALRVRVA